MSEKTGTELMMKSAPTRGEAAAAERGYKGPEVRAFLHGAEWAMAQMQGAYFLTPKVKPDDLVP